MMLMIPEQFEESFKKMNPLDPCPRQASLGPSSPT